MFRSVKQGVKKVIESSGYMVLETKLGALGHQRVYPSATYAPWSLDEDFLAAYESVRLNTLVGKYCCWELWKIVEQTARLHEGDYLEVGVWRGGTGCLIAKRLALLSVDCQVYLCDTFSGVVKAGPMDDKYKGGEHADASESVVNDLANRMGVQIQVLKGIFPDQTGAALKDRIFRFCHIDVDVYESARGCTEWIWPRLISRGVIVYDDYGYQGCDGIRRHVDEWSRTHDCLFIHNLNGHAIIVKP
jgi:O-methyltransferase